mmetsp:Transcript_53121/g.119746  ORF Transcript_53121/g.119746 Transcript_53121/m.119746 type:complete len:197 (-) Transcript_53121:90-680(-)
MHRDHAGWGERMNMENGAFWRFETMRSKGHLAKAGSGTIGSGTMGSCSLTEKDSVLQHGGLNKTVSMPIVGPHAPCGRRVGEDCGMSEVGSEPGEVHPLRRQPRVGGGLEERLQFLERSFSGPRVPAGSVTAASFTATAGGSSASGRGIATGTSRGSRGITTAASSRYSTSSYGRSSHRGPRGSTGCLSPCASSCA